MRQKMTTMIDMASNTLSNTWCGQKSSSLTDNDNKLARELKSAKKEHGAESNEFKSAKENTIKRENELIGSLNKNMLYQERMRVFSTIIEFDATLRSSGCTVRELKGSTLCNNIPVSYGDKYAHGDPIYASANMTPKAFKETDKPSAKKVMSYLSTNKWGSTSYFDHISKHVREMDFMPQITKFISTTETDNGTMGVAEDHTGTIFIDTFSENNGDWRPAWLIASTIIHEAAHVEFYQDMVCDPTSPDVVILNYRSEIYAKNAEVAFLNAVLKNDLSPKEAKEIRAYISDLINK
jgi:hypothetical protein